MNSSEQYLDSLLQGTVMNESGKDSGMERIAAIQNGNNTPEEDSEDIFSIDNLIQDEVLSESGSFDEPFDEPLDEPIDDVVEDTNEQKDILPEDFFLTEDFLNADNGAQDELHDFFSGEEIVHDDEMFLQDDALLNNTLISQDVQPTHDDLIIPESTQDIDFSFDSNDELADIGALLNADFGSTSEENDNNDDMLALLEGIANDEPQSDVSSGEFDIFAMDSIDEDNHADTSAGPVSNGQKSGDVLFENPQMMTAPLEQSGVKVKVKKAKKVKEKAPKEKTPKEKKVKEKKVKEKKSREKSNADNNEAMPASMLEMLPDQTGLEIETLFEGDSIDDIQERPKKKSGFFAKITEALFTEYEDDESPSDKKKKKKGKNGAADDEAQAVSDENTDIMRELDEEDEENAEKSKKKKDKKVKKEKPDKSKETVADSGQKLPVKKIGAVFIIMISLMVIIIVVSVKVPVAIRKQSARRAYYTEADYKKAYKELKGLDLNKSDKILLDKISTLLRVETKLDTYKLHMRLDERLEALDSLFDGVIRYHNMCTKAEELKYNISDKLYEIYARILLEFEREFKLTEKDVNEVLSYEDDVVYTKILHSIIEGNGVDIFSQKNDDEPIDSNNSMDNTEGLENVLPGEQEAIDQVDDYMNNL